MNNWKADKRRGRRGGGNRQLKKNRSKIEDKVTRKVNDRLTGAFIFNYSSFGRHIRKHRDLKVGEIDN